MSKTNRQRLLLVAAVLGAGAFIFFRNFRSAVNDTTDTGRYVSVLNDLGYPVPTKLDIPKIDLFPAKIPDDATNVRFFYRPHFLQNSTILQLRCTRPLDKIDEAIRTVVPIAKSSYSFGPTSRPQFPNDPLFRDETNHNFADLPSDFEVYVVNSHKSGIDTGYSIGVAISKQRHEIIYWLQD